MIDPVIALAEFYTWVEIGIVVVVGVVFAATFCSGSCLSFLWRKFKD